MIIPESITTKYNISTYEEYVHDKESLEEYCRLILRVTDHIPNKIIEAQILGETAEDYTEILRYRQFARDEINKLRG